MVNAKRFLSLLGLLSLTVFFLVPVPAGAAAARNTTGGITLSPFIQQISIAPVDAGKTFNLTIANHTTGLQELNLSSRDFGSLNDTGGILLGGTTNYTQKYGLTSWITIGTDTVVLQPNESRVVPVTINNRQSLQPGGHYGAVVASVNSLEDQNGNKVVINQQILSLVLVNKVGGEHYDLKLTGIQPSGNWFHLPSSVRLRFQNPGNVHVVPRGVVQLESPTGMVIAIGIINSESAFVLPETYRELYVPLTAVSRGLPLPGLYHITVEYRYDGLERTAVKHYAVRFIDLGLYLLALVIVIIAVWRFLRHRKADNRALKKSVSKK